MTKITKKMLPNGTVPYQHLPKAIADVIMQLNENIGSLKDQLAEAQSAIIELQRKKGG